MKRGREGSSATRDADHEARKRPRLQHDPSSSAALSAAGAGNDAGILGAESNMCTLHSPHHINKPAEIPTLPIVSEHPFEAVATDHAETPIVAYQHITPLLRLLAEKLHKTTEELAIYDPFYCEGSMKTRLRSLGFSNVYNENEDFYAVQAAGTVPKHDVIITNPPFSGDHITKLLQFVAKNNKPYLLLLPEFVAGKRCFFDFIARNEKPHFLGPKHSPYAFVAPVITTNNSTTANNDGISIHHTVKDGTAGAVAPLVASRRSGSDVLPGHFQCVWFANFRKYTTSIIENWRLYPENEADCCLVDDFKALPRLAPAKPLTPAERRWRKKQAKLQNHTATESFTFTPHRHERPGSKR